MATKEEVKAKWRELAKEWWKSSGRTSCYCDDNGCLVDGENQMQSKVLEPGQGYLHHLTKRIYCEECVRTDDWTKSGRGFSPIPYDMEKEITKWTW